MGWSHGWRICLSNKNRISNYRLIGGFENQLIRLRFVHWFKSRVVSSYFWLTSKRMSHNFLSLLTFINLFSNIERCILTYKIIHLELTAMWVLCCLFCYRVRISYHNISFNKKIEIMFHEKQIFYYKIWHKT